MPAKPPVLADLIRARREALYRLHAIADARRADALLGRPVAHYLPQIEAARAAFLAARLRLSQVMSGADDADLRISL